MRIMENKYYVPDISEFHVGFEYELRQADIWNKDKVRQNDCFSDLQGEGIRIKYLDRDDIVQLGWEWSDFHGNFQIKRDIDSYWVIEPIPDNKISITLAGYYIVFVGRINNKSELRKLMSMLDIPIKQ